MPWPVWIALLFVLLVGVLGVVHLVREGLALWRAFRSLTGLLGRASAVLGARADEAARKAGASGDAAARLTTAVERLARSAAYARVVANAGGGALAAYSLLRGRVPRK